MSHITEILERFETRWHFDGRKFQNAEAYPYVRAFIKESLTGMIDEAIKGVGGMKMRSQFKTPELLEAAQVGYERGRLDATQILKTLKGE